MAEQLVDEWLNRRGFFTLRGVRQGVSEIDLLGIRRGADGSIEAWHVEVQVSFRPVSYLGKLTTSQQAELGVNHPNSSKTRPREIIAAGIEAWVAKKFKDPKKARMREARWSGLDWQFKLVHAAMHDPTELLFVGENGVELIPLHRVLGDLCDHRPGDMMAAAGSDIAEIVQYFARHSAAP
jgi:hypothetical protein